MRLTRVAVANHSRLEDLSLEVREHLVLVGPNDVGKSSLLRCLDFLLGASNAQIYQRISAQDFRDKEQPLIIEADLVDFGATDEGLFPDEITVDPSNGTKSLTLRLTGTTDGENLSVTRNAPGGGTGRQLSRSQIDGIGWRFLSATAISRDLREDRRGTVDDILEAVDLGAEQDDFDALAKQFQERLESSAVLSGLRGNLADQLSKALPHPVVKDDLAFIPGATVNKEPLNDVQLRVNKDGEQRSLVEQSDGTRALYAIALYDLVSVSSNVVAIDEPEIHLHPTSQRSLAKLLQSGSNQKVLATHSADIAGAFSPECIVAVRYGGRVVQPSAGFLTNDQKMSVRWWVRDKLEPLTALRVIAVEGISDRIILERASGLTNRNLDRLGVSVIETGGAGDMGAVVKLFGATGFDIPMAMLIDEDARQATADKCGVPPADLEQHATWVSNPDLEAEYVSAIGAADLWQALNTSPLFTPNELANCTATGPGGRMTDTDIASFCRKKSNYKVRAAMVVASMLTQPTVRSITSISKLLDEFLGA